MREIKFRAWYNPNNEMINWIEIQDCIRKIDWDYFMSDCELMQFTGLTDKNGVEIFEGDILKIIEEDEDSCMGRTFEYICEVCFSGGEYEASYTLKHERFYKKHTLLGYCRCETEVIGNVHQNHELLEVKS